MNKHTPGPWLPSESNIVADKEANEVAEVYGDNHEQEQANAKLIAAAPELFECLESKLLHIEEWIDFMGNEPEDLERLAKAKAALEKVRG